MKKLLFLILFFPAISDAQLYVHAGASPLKGTLGMEYQINRFSVVAGVGPERLYDTGWFWSYSGALTTYFKINPAIMYLSFGAASKGVVEQNAVGCWTTPVPAVYVMIGTRFYPNMYAPMMTDRLSFDFGIGASMTEHSTVPDVVIDFEVNFSLAKYK